MSTLLVVDDEPNILLCFRRTFRSMDVRVVTAETGEDALRAADMERPDVVVLDLRLPDASGLEVFRRLKEQDPKCLTVFITAQGTTDTAIEAMKHGAFDYLLKPLDVPRLREVVQRALRIRRMMQVPAVFEGTGAELAADEQPTPSHGGHASGPESRRQGADVIVGRCPAMQAVYKSIGRVAPQNVNVLILGESGTGKELVARAIYQHSRRADRTFLAVNCAAIPETLLESELFGHEQGAFTGADRRRIGKFEQCDGATLFLDEVGDLAPATQAKLLRVLQDSSFQRLGGNAVIQTDVRVIAATNRNLSRMVEEGTFRGDLYFRLANFTIHLPPLRKRLEDLPLLVEHLVARLNAELGTGISAIPQETLDLLAKRPWPGNIRELDNCLRTALLHAAGHVLLPEFLASEAPGCAAARNTFAPGPKPPMGADVSPPSTSDVGDDFRELIAGMLHRQETDIYGRLVRRFDELVLQLVLERTRGNQVQASRILGITRSTLRAKLRAIQVSRRGPDEPAHQGDAADRSPDVLA